MKYYMLTTDQGLGKGGIQTWAYYMIKFLKYYNLYHNSCCIKDERLLGILKTVKANFVSHVFILMDWQKIVFVIIALFLSYLKILRSKFIIILHGNEILNLNVFKRIVIRAICISRNVYFVANSMSVGEIFLSLYGRKIDYVCNPFIDTKDSVKNGGGRTNRNIRILFTVTRIVRRKNISSVILALKELLIKHPTLLYYIAGDGPELSNLRDTVEKLSLSDNVKILGNISENEKSHYYSIADLFILPSLFDYSDGSIEGFGIVFIEANMYGVPVISGDTGGMPEAVIDGITGFQSTGSIMDIKEKIEKALNHNFNRNELMKHAERFDYRNQDAFAEFLIKQSV